MWKGSSPSPEGKRTKLERGREEEEMVGVIDGGKHVVAALDGRR